MTSAVSGVSTAELPGWRETPAKQSNVEFVAAVTDRDSPAAEHKWTVIDMAADWATIHPAT